MDFPSSFPSHLNYQPSPASNGQDTLSTTNTSTTVRPQVLNRQPTESLPDSSFPRVDQPASVPGHHPLGRTLAIHSVCVHPEYQKLGLGRTLLKSYLQRMESAGIADRAAVIVRPEKVGWYVGCFGFEDKGESQCNFAGGGWKNLVRIFPQHIVASCQDFGAVAREAKFGVYS